MLLRQGVIMNNSDIQHHPRTTLVSVMGWVSLVGGILLSLLIILNTALLFYIQQMDEGPLFSEEELAMMPSGFDVFTSHLVLFGSVAAVSSILTAVAGFGLVRRRDWGRQIIIFLLAASIVLVFAVIPTSFMDSGGEDLPINPLMLKIFGVIEAVMAIALHGWLIWKLRTPQIRGEFVEPRSESLTR